MSFKSFLKFIWSFFVISSFGVYVYWNRFQEPQPIYVAPGTPDPTQAITDAIRSINEIGNAPASQIPPINTKIPVVPSTPVTMPPQTMPMHMGMYRDGTYDGGMVYAYTGNIRVKAVISGGKLTDVQVTDYSGSGTSHSINSFAVPMLKSEAIQAQSANVDIVSGATATSGAFRESLGAALASAKN